MATSTSARTLADVDTDITKHSQLRAALRDQLIRATGTRVKELVTLIDSYTDHLNALLDERSALTFAATMGLDSL